jgi:hypothetical protein
MGGGGEGACGVFSVSKLFSLFCLIVNSAEDNDNFRPFPSHALLKKNSKPFSQKVLQMIITKSKFIFKIKTVNLILNKFLKSAFLRVSACLPVCPD